VDGKVVKVGKVGKVGKAGPIFAHAHFAFTDAADELNVGPYEEGEIPSPIAVVGMTALAWHCLLRVSTLEKRTKFPRVVSCESTFAQL
jgi:hypothetical protein